jgi:hypothetical protein
VHPTASSNHDYWAVTGKYRTGRVYCMLINISHQRARTREGRGEGKSAERGEEARVHRQTPARNCARFKPGTGRAEARGFSLVAAILKLWHFAVQVWNRTFSSSRRVIQLN